MLRRTVCSALSILLIATPSFAQSTAHLQKGQRLRLTIPALYHARTVEFVETRGDSLIVLDGKERRPVPIAAITKVEIADGKRSQTGKGALIGGVLGVGTLGLAALMFSQEGETCRGSSGSYAPGGSGCLGSDDSVAGLFVIAAGLGVALGAVIGNVARTDRWKPITIAPTVERQGSIGLRISVPASRR